MLKDFTSILSLPPSARPSVLAALREVYDGRWTRTLGADGGRSLEWSGRIAVIGAVTTAWDSAHTAVSAMGDRFVLLRLDSSHNRIAGGRQAVANTGSETQMRRELGAAVKGVLDGLDTNAIRLDHHESEALLAAADLVTRARTAVERDRQGNVRMPTMLRCQHDSSSNSRRSCAVLSLSGWTGPTQCVSRSVALVTRCHR